MPIGEVLRYLPSRSGSRLKSILSPFYKKGYIRFYGIADLHTHIRWRAIRPLISFACSTGREAVLDVGCGEGLMSLEVARRLTRGRVLGVDIADEGIGLANELRKRSH